MSDQIAITEVRLGAEEERLVLDVLRSGQLAQGPMVARLEEQFTALCGVRHAIAVNNGTTALVAAIEVAGLRPGDEVVTTPFTFVATLNAILEAGATAVFADITPETFTIDPQLVAAAITDRTRVVMPVHLYGQPADMGAISKLAAGAHLVIIEDAAQAVGASVGGRRAGSFGTGCFSLYATKNVTTGEGGMITTDDGDVADRLRMLRNQGMRERYQYEVAGHNYRLTDLQAAVAIPQLERLEASSARRGAIAERLSAGLDGVEGVVRPVIAAGRTHVFHQYTIRVTPAGRLDRDALATRLRERGIGTGVYYPRVVFDYDCYRDHPGVVISEVPEAARAAREVISLPAHPHLSEADVDRVIDEIRTAMGA